MKQVPVGSVFALVDDEDFPVVSRHTWHASNQGSTTYAHRNVLKDPRAVESMHRLVMGAPSHRWMVIDHIDGNGLNNCKSNLRFVSMSGNALNQSKHRESNDTGIRKVGNRWTARVLIEKKYHHIGTFDSKEAAIEARKSAINNHFKGNAA